ncbi:Transcription factor BIM2 [Linum perenne]
MRGKGNQSQQEEEEYEEEELVVASRKDGGAPSSNVSATNSNNSNRDGKNSDKASAVRSKHSVTEQRRRSKINESYESLISQVSDIERTDSSMRPEERYSILSIRERNMQVIEYVRFLQEKVQKYEGPFQGWPADPTKLMPWRNSHWQVQNLAGHPQAMNNGSGIGPVFPAKLDDNGIAATSSSMLASAQNAIEPDSLRDVAMLQPDSFPALRHLQTEAMPQQPLPDLQSAECPVSVDSMNQQDELAIEGGTINISSAYSEGLLNSLTQALQTAGVDLSGANISLQIDLGKRANRGLSPGTSATTKGSRDGNGAGESHHVHKRMKM